MENLQREKRSKMAYNTPKKTMKNSVMVRLNFKFMKLYKKKKKWLNEGFK